MDACEHERAALLVEFLMQAVNGFQPAESINETPRMDRIRAWVSPKVGERLIELSHCRRKEERTCEKCNAHMLAFSHCFDALLLEAFNVSTSCNVDVDAGNFIQEDRSCKEGADQDGLCQVEDDGGEHGDGEGDHVGLEAFAEDEFDCPPFIHAHGGDHQHASQCCQWDHFP
jgi:hypothetical protein